MTKKILIIHTSWYEEYVSKMLSISKEILEDFDCTCAVAPGALELAALAAQKIQDSSFEGVLFLGIVIKGETSHYDLVTQETFRSIGTLANDYPNRSFINNVICVENENQLEERLERNTNTSKTSTRANARR